MLFTTRRPSKATVDAYYAADGPWAQDRGNTPQVATSKVSENIFNPVADVAGLRHPEPGARVLDIGCGNGAWLNSLARYGWTTFGLEPSTRIAFERHQEVTTIPADHSFDFVILHHVIEHLREPAGMLQAAAAALRPGGLLYVSVPSLDTLPGHGDFRYCINGVYHLQAFTEPCLRTLLISAGFVDVARVPPPIADARAVKQMRLIARRRVADSTDASPPATPLDAARTALRIAGLLVE